MSSIPNGFSGSPVSLVESPEHSPRGKITPREHLPSLNLNTHRKKEPEITTKTHKSFLQNIFGPKDRSSSNDKSEKKVQSPRDELKKRDFKVDQRPLQTTRDKVNSPRLTDTKMRNENRKSVTDLVKDFSSLSINERACSELVKAFEIIGLTLQKGESSYSSVINSLQKTEIPLGKRQGKFSSGKTATLDDATGIALQLFVSKVTPKSHQVPLIQVLHNRKELQEVIKTQELEQLVVIYSLLRSFLFTCHSSVDPLATTAEILYSAAVERLKEKLKNVTYSKELIELAKSLGQETSAIFEDEDARLAYLSFLKNKKRDLVGATLIDNIQCYELLIGIKINDTKNMEDLVKTIREDIPKSNISGELKEKYGVLFKSDVVYTKDLFLELKKELKLFFYENFLAPTNSFDRCFKISAEYQLMIFKKGVYPTSFEKIVLK